MSITARHLANLAPSSRYSASRSRRPSRPSVIDLAGAERQRLGALVDLDAGQRAGLLDDLDQRRAVLGLLADGLVVQDDAGDVLRHRLAGAEHHLAIVAAIVLGVLDADRVEALLDRARDSSAARMPRPGATMASATRLSSVRFMEPSLLLVRAKSARSLSARVNALTIPECVISLRAPHAQHTGMATTAQTLYILRLQHLLLRCSNQSLDWALEPSRRT